MKKPSAIPISKQTGLPKKLRHSLVTLQSTPSAVRIGTGSFRVQEVFRFFLISLEEWKQRAAMEFLQNAWRPMGRSSFEDSSGTGVLCIFLLGLDESHDGAVSQATGVGTQ